MKFQRVCCFLLCDGFRWGRDCVLRFVVGVLQLPGVVFILDGHIIIAHCHRVAMGE